MPVMSCLVSPLVSDLECLFTNVACFSAFRMSLFWLVCHGLIILILLQMAVTLRVSD